MLKIHVVPVTPFQQNCSIVWCTETLRGAVIDPGGELDRVLAVVAKEKITLEKILLTHAHIDHAAATAELAELAEALQVPVVTTLMAKGAFPDSHPLCVGMPGMPAEALALDAPSTRASPR